MKLGCGEDTCSRHAVARRGGHVHNEVGSRPSCGRGRRTRPERGRHVVQRREKRDRAVTAWPAPAQRRHRRSRDASERERPADTRHDAGLGRREDRRVLLHAELLLRRASGERRAEQVRGRRGRSGGSDSEHDVPGVVRADAARLQPARDAALPDSGLVRGAPVEDRPVARPGPRRVERAAARAQPRDRDDRRPTGRDVRRGGVLGARGDRREGSGGVADDRARAGPQDGARAAGGREGHHRRHPDEHVPVLRRAHAGEHADQRAGRTHGAPVSARRAAPAVAPFVALVGAATVALGTVLPWLTLFAGLHRYAGVAGLYGRLLLLGALVGGVCAWRAWRARQASARYLAAARGLGLALLVASLWLIRNLFATRAALSAMWVPRAGPGLYVCAAGALLLALAPGRRLTARAAPQLDHRDLGRGA